MFLSLRNQRVSLLQRGCEERSEPATEATLEHARDFGMQGKVKAKMAQWHDHELDDENCRRRRLIETKLKLKSIMSAPAHQLIILPVWWPTPPKMPSLPKPKLGRVARFVRWCGKKLCCGYNDI